ATVGTWTRVALPFVYNANDTRTPQYILITTTSSSNQTGGSSGSTFYLDDIEAIYNPTIATGTINPLTYYVSASAGASVSVPFTLTGTYTAGNTVTAQLSDASGSFAAPVNIGSVTATTSGTISATIPAGTATGAGYRIRVVSSTPALTATDNGSNISINLVNNSIAPITAQTIAANANGTALTVTEASGVTSREWKFATVSGGPYTSFAPAETGTTYTPNFAAPGTYYVVAVSTFPGSLTVTSNEVVINVVGNSIAPASTQSLLVSTNGTPLTVTETPAGSAREWKYATVSGGPYSSFAPAQTGTTYTPNFATGGVYYVVAVSTISSLSVTSNEVQISVSSVTLSTGTIAGSPFEFSPSAPGAAVTVPYTTSSAFNNGNVFTAQLSDATGSFASPLNIGSVTSTLSGSIAATIPSATPAGTAYRIRVVASSPNVLGNDNGSDLIVDQFNNSVAPATTQTITVGTNGSALNVTTSQTASTEWMYSITAGGPYTAFSPMEMGTSYTPNFATPGTYYVVAVSTNQYNDDVTSNEVTIVVENGTSLTTGTVVGSPFYVSASANVQVNVPFTSAAVFNAGNTFTAELSDENGSFANPIAIGTLSSTTVAPITATIPNTATAGNGYRIRVTSSDPAIIGTDNGADLEIIPLAATISPAADQTLFINQVGTELSVVSTHPNSTIVWMFSEIQGSFYGPVTPSQTGTTYSPQFNYASTFYIVAEVKNAINDVVLSNEVTVIVTEGTGISDAAAQMIKAYWSGNDFVVDLTAAELTAPSLQILTANGQIVSEHKLNVSALNRVATSLPAGTYIFNVTDNGKNYTGKTSKQ
ncbi:MAG: T9SS type A sorting domain-containing protein, partial [Bacteroidetes bacterium]|nr:T9SS type A sorting domain-containing protein [Bacteroidota bacterium]